MNVLIIPDKFKGSLTAQEICELAEETLKSYNTNFAIKSIPFADGGEGSLDSITDALQLKTRKIQVFDPLMRPIEAYYKYDKHTAYIEMAQASGLNLLNSHERNCYFTSSFGTGQLIKDCIENEISNILLFIGGSATNDAGIGMAAALGYSFIDKNGSILDPIGKNLSEIDDYISTSNIFSTVNIQVATDVNNPLYGINGAAHVYGPQKGASKSQILALDEGLKNISQLVKRKTGIDYSNVPGSGAAGGVGAGAQIFFNATIQSGFSTMVDILSVESSIKWADLVITGEGKLDRQTIEGKVVAGIASLTKKHNKKLVIICGERAQEIDSPIQKKIGVWKIMALKNDSMTTQESMSNARQLLESKVHELAICISD